MVCKFARFTPRRICRLLCFVRKVHRLGMMKYAFSSTPALLISIAPTVSRSDSTRVQSCMRVE